MFLPFRTNLGVIDPHMNIFNVEKSFDDQAKKEIEDSIIENLGKETKPFKLSEPVDIYKEGVEAIVKDHFTECFAPKPPTAWNFNVFLFIIWAIGVFIRYFVLLPLRIIWFILGSIIFLAIYFSLYFLPESETRVKLIVS